MANYRGGRINEEVRREVSNIIQNEIKDPRLTAMVSVTAVKVTKDLRYAKVFVSIFGKDEEEKNNTFTALKNASGYISYTDNIITWNIKNYSKETLLTINYHIN